MKNINFYKRITKIRKTPLNKYEIKIYYDNVIKKLKEDLIEYKQKFHEAQLKNDYDASQNYALLIREYKSAIAVLFAKGTNK